MENTKEKTKINHVIYRVGDIGSVIVSDDIIAIIAGMAAADVDGVDSLRDAAPVEKEGRIHPAAFNKAVSVRLHDDELRLGLVLNLKYGYTIPAVSAQVQDKVSSSVENMLGCNVTSVNISVSDVIMTA